MSAEFSEGRPVAMHESMVQGAVVTATATVAVFAGLILKVYEQIKGVMEQSFHAEMRPVVRLRTHDLHPEPSI